MFLDSGKHLVIGAGGSCLMHDGNFLIRSEAKKVLLVPGSKVQSVETEYATEEEVDAMFAGEGNR